MYARNKSSVRFDANIPDEYLNITSGQSEILEKLSKHIQDEKQKVTHFFDDLSQEVTKMITDKKNEYLHNLDQQLFNLRYWYIYFDKQLKKAFPSEEDVPFLFPSKEDLNNRIGKIQNVTQLLAFVRNLKEDLNEKKTPIGELGKSGFLQKLSQELKKAELTNPYYKQGELSISELKEQLSSEISKLLEQSFILEDPIADATKGGDFGSLLATLTDFNLIKTWLPSGTPVKPKLLYRASRDGKDAASFHKKCDGKTNTITLIKAEFTNSKQRCIVGGFLDLAWSSNGAYINTNKAFLFSLTAKAKSQVATTSYAGYGVSTQGPTFGGGHDLVVNLSGSNQCYMNQHSYTNSSQLNPLKSTGHQYFTPLEVEVFELTK